MEEEKFLLYASASEKGIWGNDEDLVGLLRRDDSGCWEGLPTGKIFSQEQLEKVVAAIPNDYSFQLPEKRNEDDEPFCLLNLDAKLTLGMVLYVMKNEDILLG